MTTSLFLFFWTPRSSMEGLKAPPPLPYHRLVDLYDFWLGFITFFHFLALQPLRKSMRIHVKTCAGWYKSSFLKIIRLILSHHVTILFMKNTVLGGDKWHGGIKWVAWRNITDDERWECLGGIPSGKGETAWRKNIRTCEYVEERHKRIICWWWWDCKGKRDTINIVYVGEGKFFSGLLCMTM